VSGKRLILIIIFFPILTTLVHPQTNTNPGSSTYFDMTGFPQWTKVLRRYEIVAFGSFPFSFLISAICMDLYRSSRHNWASGYAPWPVKMWSGASIDRTRTEQLRTIGFAVAGSLLIAAADLIIVQMEKGKERRHERIYPPGTPIIIRRPLDETVPADAAETEPRTSSEAESMVPASPSEQN
jgi:hypothetical protein